MRRHVSAIPFTPGAVLAVALLLALATPAPAHHGWSGYDSSKGLTLTGTIREAGYEHPHGYVRLEAGDKVWLVVLAPPTRMENRGLPRTALTPGATATVVGYPSRTDPGELRAERITVAGKTTELR
jgi:uncharacterized protein DUF6152